MADIYFLSVFDNYVSMILDGSKKGEFRKNPNFGMLDDIQLQLGDWLVLVSRFSDLTVPSRISCLCKVETILREEEMYSYFMHEESGKWKEAGCAQDSERDWHYFKNCILAEYNTAIKIVPYPLKEYIEISEIVHRSKGHSWKGVGFASVTHLKEYEIRETTIEVYFERLAID
jgi:hypothetical protein